MCKETPSQLKRYSINTLIKWRDAARDRVDEREIILKDAIEQLKEFYIKLGINQLDKSNHKDKIWITKLNKALVKKVGI